MNKIKNFILKYKITIGVCVLMAAFGFGYWVLGSPGTTTIGENVSVAGQISIAGGSPGAGKVLTSDATGLATWATGGLGYSLNVIALSLTTWTDATTYYFGCLSLAPQTSADLAKVYIPKSGKIKAAYIIQRCTTVGTNEAWSVYIRLNNTTDTLIQTLSNTDNPRVWSNTGLDIAVVQGDYIEIKTVCPTWVTNAGTCVVGGVIFIE